MALAHDFTDRIMAYASFNTGFKSGGHNQATLSSTLVNPEQLDAYELGIKTQWFDNRLRANAALWFYDYQDIQVGAITGVGLTAVQNAAAAELNGLDVDFEFRPTSNFTLRGGFTALQSEYTEFTAAQTFAHCGGHLMPATSGRRRHHLRGGASARGGRTGRRQLQLRGRYVGATHHLCAGVQRQYRR